MVGNWVDLRGDNGRLYGRLDRATLKLEIVRGDRRTTFDLLEIMRVGAAGGAKTDRVERAPDPAPLAE